MKKITPTIATERSYTVQKEKDLPISSYFGEDTFNDKVMQAKLPKIFYSKLKESIEKGKKLDIETANAVAHAMKEWALENGATHFAHWFQPMTGASRGKARRVHRDFRTGRGDRALHRRAAGAGRAGRVELPQRRPALHLRSARLHRVGHVEPRVSPQERDRHNALHPLGVHIVPRRGPGQENAAAPLDPRGQRQRAQGAQAAGQPEIEERSCPTWDPSRNISASTWIISTSGRTWS